MGTHRKVVGTVAGSQYIIINTRHYYILDRMNLQKWHGSWVIVQGHKACGQQSPGGNPQCLPQVPLLWTLTSSCFWGSAVICIFTSQTKIIEIEKGFYSVEKRPFMCMLVTQSCPTLCDPTDCSLPGYPCPWNSPGKNTGVGSHFLLQGNLPKPGIKLRSPVLQADSLLSIWDMKFFRIILKRKASLGQN